MIEFSRKRVHGGVSGQMDVFTRTDAEGKSGVQAFRLSHETYGVCRGSVRAEKRKTHSQLNTSGGDALKGNTRSHPEHDG